MLKVAVLVSGGGTNLQALLDSEARGENPHGKISLVVASKPGVYALERAKNAGVPGVVVRRKDYASAEEFDAALLGLPVLAAGIPTLMEAREGKDLVVTPRALDSVIAHGAALLGAAINRALQPRLTVNQLCWLAGQ